MRGLTLGVAAFFLAGCEAVVGVDFGSAHLVGADGGAELGPRQDSGSDQGVQPVGVGVDTGTDARADPTDAGVGADAASSSHDASVCAPSCQGKACGAEDGCGGICTSGACAPGQQCNGGVCSGSAVYTHYDGYGHTWTDSTPLHTYSQAEAQSACNAYVQALIAQGVAPPSCIIATSTCFSGAVGEGFVDGSGVGVVWDYEGDAGDTWGFDPIAGCGTPLAWY